jgi:RNA polymerase sigma-70 factor, ECF subfamily
MGEPSSLSQIFLARLGSRRADHFVPSVEWLESALQQMDTAGRTAWPTVTLDAEVFAAHVADRVGVRSDALDEILNLHASDLFLACACSRSVPAALAAFERFHLARIPGIVSRIDSSSAFADDVAQAIRERFLVSADGQPSRIAEYSGRGALSNWVRAITVRIALRVRREQRTGGPVDSDVAVQFRGATDPELDYLKLRYRNEYEEALRAALASLDDREAILLKLHYVDGLNIDQIGVVYGVHRSTIARWRSAIRRKILGSTREQLQRRLSLTDSEFDSVVALVRSQLAFSIRSALRRPAASEP